MKTIIVCPWYSFVISCLAIYRHLEDKQHTPAIFFTFNFASLPGLDSFRRLSSGEDISQFVANYSDISIVSWMQDSDLARKPAIELLQKVITASPNCKISYFFYSDGINNVYSGEKRMHDEICKIREISKPFTYLPFHCNTSLVDNAEIIKSSTINSIYSHLSRNLVKHRILDSVSAVDGSNERNILIAPCRPWCSSEFHEGMYDFGNLDTLQDIYSKLVKLGADFFDELNLSRKAKPIILFKSMPGFPAHSRAALQGLTETGFKTLDVSNTLPNFYQFDIYMYDLIKSSPTSNIIMLCLDSTSFYAPIHMRDECSPGFLGCLQGFPEHEILGYRGGAEFIARKLKAKLNTLIEYYTRLGSRPGMGKVEVTTKDNTFFAVSDLSRR